MHLSLKKYVTLNSFQNTQAISNALSLSTSLVKWNIVSVNAVKMILHIKKKHSKLFFLKEEKK